MNFDNLQDSLYELIKKVKILDFFSEFCEYIVYFFVVVKAVDSFIFLGGVVEAVIYYLTFLLIVLTFAKRNYVPLIVLFASNTLNSIHKLVTIISHQHFLFYSTYEPFPFWQAVFSLVINIFLASFFFNLLKKQKKAK